jgi:AmmeMemoRadiSam system protein A
MEADLRALLRVARESLRAHLEGAPPPPPERLFGDAAAIPPALREPCGVFVTLRNREHLRGCTGYIEARAPLWQSVRDLVVSSASRDYRFPPIAPAEEPHIRIEISVLTPPRPIQPPEIEIGRHGLIARMRGRSGLLLPQVATDWGWGPEEFLARTCEKAGLPRDAWKSADCQLLGFEAQVFHEDEVLADSGEGEA